MGSRANKQTYRDRTLCQRLKEHLAFSGEGVTTPNWPIIGLMFLCLFASAFTLTFLYPFLPEMILGFGYSEQEKGYYTGLVASSVFAGRATGSYFWGWLSDRKGRKPVILLSLIGSAIFSLVFGFTNNLTMAIITRFLSGVFNGILGTAKTVLYEVSDDTNQAVGMSMISLAWGAGIIMGPAVGGHLASPFKKYPTAFHEGFFTQFPYIIPATVTFLINVIVAVVIFVYQPETLHLRNITVDVPESEPSITDERTGTTERKLKSINSCNDVEKYDLLDKNHLTADVTYEPYVTAELQLSHNDNIPNTHKSCPNLSCINNERSLIPHSHTVPITQKNTATREDIVRNRASFEEDSKLPRGIVAAFVNSSFVFHMRQADVRNSIILFTTFSFAIIGFDDVFNVWASTVPRLDGLGFGSDEIGTILSLVGIPLLLLLIFLLSFMVNNLGIKKTYMLSAFIIMISVTVCPTLHLLSDRPTVLWSVLLLVLIPCRICASCCFSTTALFINNSVTPDQAGTVNGIGMMFTALARTLAPSIGGSTFAWSISNGLGAPFDISLIFFMFGLVFWSTIVICLFFPDRLNKQRKEQ